MGANVGHGCSKIKTILSSISNNCDGRLARQMLHKPEASGRLVNWSVELSEFDINYQPRTTIKDQALADFIVKCTEAN